MTLHVVYTHQCAACQAFYIPHDDVPCPRCGVFEEERFDYIPQAASSMRYNRDSYGAYTPPAWWVGSLGDHILSVLFGLFDGYEPVATSEDFETYLSDQLGRMNWGEQEYLCDHIKAIAVRVRQEMGLP